MLILKGFTCLLKYYKKYFLDKYTKQAQVQKLRSRSWFKLKSIDNFDELFKKKRSMTVIDLGAAPGGWSYYIVKKISNKSNILACDILPMLRIPGVYFLQGDCTDNVIYQKICVWIKKYKKAHIIVSDMSPKTTGISIIDVSKSLCLGYVALNMCYSFLRHEGSFLVKIFQGQGFEQYLCKLKSLFRVVKIRKPNASRSCSKEVYIVAKEFTYNKVINNC